MAVDPSTTPLIWQRTSARVARVATVLISNAIPLVGVLHYGWSATNVLVLYWLENLFVAIFTCLRIGEHCRLTRRRGHWRKDQLASSPGEIGERPTLFRDYATISLAFTLAHGTFVFAIALILAHRHADAAIWRFAFDPFRDGALILACTLAIDFFVDLMGLRLRSFAWVRGYVQKRMGRVLILHLSILGGMFAMAATNSPLGILYALIGLKTLWDLLMSRASEVTAPISTSPPSWLVKFGDHVAKHKGGSAALTKQWNLEMGAARRRGFEDEQSMSREVP
jgi:hypothetical protein